MLIASIVFNLFSLVLLYKSHKLRVQFRERLEEAIEVNRRYQEQYMVLLNKHTRQTMMLSELSEQRREK